ncbi:hypothetical protein XSR1_190017 [Xenorhabdus szentirmaii DSM 16338]|uniref:Uncharacterized protein n=1 Tax=Xenorhabdus szentirmaii DSM 16338 TaxID=1427518 RepID=W1IUB4_9GAMM|nr:hypothetical protein XSR1_190017 [Xenorhabdus szentirmaii DSM 16338]
MNKLPSLKDISPPLIMVDEPALSFEQTSSASGFNYARYILCVLSFLTFIYKRTGTLKYLYFTTTFIFHKPT